MSSATLQPRKVSRIRAPHTKLTTYDIVVSTLLTTAFCAVMAFLVMVFIWLSNMLPGPVSKAVTMMPAGDGGYEDGDPDATPHVESPEDAVPDPSTANEETDVTQLEEVVDQVVEIAENAATISAPNESTDKNNSGIPGSAEGTGGRPLGSGGGGRGGAKREQRWYVEFGDKGDLRSYAAQLDYFKIELGCLFQEEGRLVYLSDMSRPVPTVREVRTGDAEKRLFMSWQDGSEERKAADIELFKLAGIDASPGLIMHFYPAETEEMLATKEFEYGMKQPTEIRRTYFQVRRSGSTFEFVVSRQQLR